LKKRGIEIEDLVTDISDGIKFLNLLEIIGGSTIKEITGKKWNKKCRIRIQKMENWNWAFEYLKVCSAY
jgi:hypothetical protein